MLKDGNFKRVIICCSKVDLRKGIDGLASYVKLNYGLDTLEKGTVFLFSGTSVYTDQTEHTARRFSAWLPPIQCTLSGHQCMMLIQV